MDANIMSLLGGVLIGVAVTLMLLLNGRVTGVSGIVSGLFEWRAGDKFWRLAFVAGMVCGGGILFYRDPLLFTNTTGRSLVMMALAGWLVGFGTVMAGGCTSGHGVCGMSRFSIRSIVATLTFIVFGALTVFLLKHFGVGL